MSLHFFSGIKGLKTGDKITCKIEGKRASFFKNNEFLLTSFTTGLAAGAVEGNYFVMMDSVEGHSKAMFLTLQEYIRAASDLEEVNLIADAITEATPVCKNNNDCLCIDCVNDIKDAEQTQDHLRATMHL